MFLNNRYHDPTTGTFISVDPIVASTGDPYLYANGNPTTLADPDGLEALPGGEWLWEGGGAQTGKAFRVGYYHAKRRASNPFQSMWDDVTLTTFIEQAAAIETILIDDAEIYRRGPHCGPEVECFSGADTLGGRSATTFGHTQRYESAQRPNDPLVAHETQHSYDIENFGGLGFYGGYLLEWYMRSGACDCNAYHQLSWEIRANYVQSGWETGIRPRGLLSGGPR